MLYPYVVAPFSSLTTDNQCFKVHGEAVEKSERRQISECSMTHRVKGWPTGLQRLSRQDLSLSEIAPVMSAVVVFVTCPS